MIDDLRTKTISNISYSVFARGAIFALSTFASIILARNVTSSEFGIVGFASILIGFLASFGDLGIRSAVIQRAELNERGIYTGFTIQGALGIVVFAITFVAAPLAKSLFDDSEVVGVIRVLALNFMINTLVFLPNCLLTRDLNYRKLSVAGVGATIVNSLVSVVLALGGFGYWSIVFANLGGAIGSLIILNVMRPVKLRLCFDKKIAFGFLRFGGSLFLSGLIVFILFNADNFVLGMVNGSAMLGYYALAFNWGSKICGILYETVHNVLFPTFSKMQDDRNGLIKAYLRVLEYVSFTGIMVNLTLLVVSREFLVLILGHGSDKWLPAMRAFQILCVYGMFRSVLEPVGNVLLAVEKANLLLKANLFVGILELGLLYPVARYTGIEGVAVLVTIVYAMQYLVYFPYLKKELSLNHGAVFRPIKPAILSGVIIGSISLLLNPSQGPSYYTLFLKLYVATAGYVITYGLITKWKLLHETRSIVKNMIALKIGTGVQNTHYQYSGPKEVSTH